jgi:hypothetical protein
MCGVPHFFSLFLCEVSIGWRPCARSSGSGFFRNSPVLYQFRSSAFKRFGILLALLVGLCSSPLPWKVSASGHYDEWGYWIDDPGYTDPGYTDPGYTDPGYTDPGYTDPGYTDPWYTDPGYTGPSWDTDSDGDGIPDLEEIFGFPVSNWVYESHSLWTEFWDADAGTNTNVDLGWSNWVEGTIIVYTSPYTADTDGDGIPDGWERNNGLNPDKASDGSDDFDGDGLSNLLEYQNGSFLWVADSDRDGLTDGEEVWVFGSNPLDPLDPLDQGAVPVMGGPESGGPGTGTESGSTETGGPEPIAETGGTETGGGEPPVLTVEWLTWQGERFADILAIDPEAPEAHAEGDADEDGLSNFEEFLLGSDPRNPDSDGDGLLDGWEVGGLVMDFDIEYAENFDWDAYSGGDEEEAAPDLSGTFYGEYQFQTSWDLYFDGQYSGYINTDPSVPVIGTGYAMTRYYETRDSVGSLSGSSYETINLSAFYDSDGVLVFSEPGWKLNANGTPGPADGWEFNSAGTLVPIESTMPPPPSEDEGDPTVPAEDWTQHYDEVLGMWVGVLTTDSYTATWWWITTDPLDADTDSDDMPDGWEYQNWLNPTDPADSLVDPDQDDLDNATEYLHGTDPWVADTDGDGLSDGDEVKVHESDPIDPDDPVLGGGNSTSPTTGTGTTGTGTTGTGTTTDGTSTPNLFESAEWIAWVAEKFRAEADSVVTGGNADPDKDGLTNHQEYLHGTDPNVADTDGDGLSDAIEVNGFYLIIGSSWGLYFTDPLAADSDGDGVSDGAEFAAKTSPTTASYSGGLFADNSGGSSGSELEDLNGNGIPDTWEIAHGAYSVVISYGESMLVSPFAEPWGDHDNDGLSNFEEYQRGTDPTMPDSDGDGLSDGDEANVGFTVAVQVTHTETIGMLEWDEASQSYISVFYENTYTVPEYQTQYTDPTKADTDDDGLSDGDERLLGLNPNDPSDGLADADGDGLSFAMEYYLGTDPANPDTDGDLLPDGWEVAHGFDPLDPSDGLLDDEDNDGVPNGNAFASGGAAAVFGSGSAQWGRATTTRDTDGDGISDYDELLNGTDPFDPADAPSAPQPPPPPCNPTGGNGDSDGDGISDRDELQKGTDPFDPRDPPPPPRTP